MNKRYIVFIQDMWNNLYWIGEFACLNDAIPDIKDFIEPYGFKIEKGELVEYASTFGLCFDKEYLDDDSGEELMVRGFILEGDE